MTLKFASALAFLSLMTAASAFAAPVPLAVDQIPNYKIAISQAGAYNLICSRYQQTLGSIPYYMQFLSYVTSGTIDSSGAQPVLTLSMQQGEDEYDFSFTTTSDYKQVVRVDVDFKSPQQVNLGNVLAPNVVTQMTAFATDTCQ